MARPHDAMFRYTFGEPEHAAPLLRALLPPEVSRQIDWSTLARADGDLVGEDQREQHTDLVFSVMFAGQLALLYLLLEHKSRPDRWTALQVLGYLVALWQRWRRRRPRPRMLPPILPIVIHFGRGRWRTSTDLGALIDTQRLPAGAREAVEPLLPSFRFEPKDFAGRSEAEIRAMALSLHGLWTVACLQFVAPNGRDEQAVRKALAECAGILRALVLAPTGREALRALSSYLFKVTGLGRERLEALLRERIGTRAMKKFVSTYDQILMEGEARGEARGEAKGKADLLLRLLRQRFGKLPAAAKERIERASVADLDRWALAVLDAQSLRDVFADGM